MNVLHVKSPWIFQDGQVNWGEESGIIIKDDSIKRAIKVKKR